MTEPNERPDESLFVLPGKEDADQYGWSAGVNLKVVKQFDVETVAGEELNDPLAAHHFNPPEHEVKGDRFAVVFTHLHLPAGFKMQFFDQRYAAREGFFRRKPGGWCIRGNPFEKAGGF